MMVYRVAKGHAYKVRVSDRNGKARRLSTGAHDVETAEAVAEMVKGFRRRREWRVLDMLVLGTLRLTDVFDAHEAGTLDALISKSSTLDLDPLLSEWARAGASDKYVSQVRVLIPKGKRFPASDFRRQRISKFLADLPVGPATKNRYRAAVLQFARWLIEREVLDSNPVREIRGKTETPRDVWYEWKEARAIIDALPEPQRSMEALMAGSGIEWQAAAKLRGRDVDFDKKRVMARGEKNKYRNRWVVVTEPWAWEIFHIHAKRALPNGLLFEIKPVDAIKVHRSAVEALKYKDSTLHDWRHTYAVNSLRRGMSAAVVKRQLGHAPTSTMVERVYGVWIVDERDYERNVTTNVTTGAK